MKHLLQNKLLNTIVKLAIFAALLFVLYRQLFANEKMAIAYAHFLDNFQGNYLLMAGVLLFMVLNWTIESIKWKLLIDKLHRISWSEAIQGILFGVTFSLFTPSRIGEFGGRIFALNTERKEAIVSTMIGSFAQIVVNLSLGALGLLLYVVVYTDIDKYLLTAFAFLYCFMVFAIHVVYYNLDVVSTKFSHVAVFKKVYKYIHIVDLYSNREFLWLEIYSAVRYVIYCLQFVLLLQFFGFDLSLSAAMILVAAIFFVQTINPLNVAIIDFGFRGNVAAYFLAGFTDNPIAILATTVTLWFVNLILPAIIGGVAALRFTYFKEE
ncbi:MAG TPA: lysylphosphatidylglycerol synthase domain-containing protein [Chitinophagales bacterium]|nr:lysylphosphatidylglycerol synthase domain-containing protein [Chitinophagales bacterium]HQO32137.1 lysylphosphatidylglycerol synthase domain-containing protein [Chitinophagales bacterium]